MIPELNAELRPQLRDTAPQLTLLLTVLAEHPKPTADVNAILMAIYTKTDKVPKRKSVLQLLHSAYKQQLVERHPGPRGVYSITAEGQQRLVQLLVAI